MFREDEKDAITTFVDDKGNHYIRFPYDGKEFDFFLGKDAISDLLPQVINMFLERTGEQISSDAETISFTYKKEAFETEVKDDLAKLQQQINQNTNSPTDTKNATDTSTDKTS